MKPARHIYNLLRSRKLAFWPIAAFVLYAAVATSLVKSGWGRACANPLFIAVATLLALSTAACAWECTAAAAFKKRGLRVRSGGGRLVAVSTRISLIGSPHFHWSLIAWFCYAFSIHLHVTMGWRDERFAWAAIVPLPVVLFALPAWRSSTTRCTAPT